MGAQASGPDILHASAVALGPSGLLILGRSGSGKSTLALELMAFGARLVADDRVEVRNRGGVLEMRAPVAIAGRIEARGLGILAAKSAPARAMAVVDLDRIETARLPEEHEAVIAGVALPCLGKVETSAFAAMLLAYLAGGRSTP